MGLVVLCVTFARTDDAQYTKYLAADNGLDPLGSMWMLWSSSVTISYLNVKPIYQPLFAFATAVLWNAYLSDTIHAPCPVVITDSMFPDYLREARRWEQ